MPSNPLPNGLPGNAAQQQLLQQHLAQQQRSQGMLPGYGQQQQQHQSQSSSLANLQAAAQAAQAAQADIRAPSTRITSPSTATTVRVWTSARSSSQPGSRIVGPHSAGMMQSGSMHTDRHCGMS